MKNKPLITIFITIFIDLAGFGIIIPLLPFYAQRFGASGMDIGLLVSVFSLVTFIFMPVLGSLSDQYGRRPVLLVSMLVSALAYFLFAFAGSLWMLFVSRFMAGVAHSNLSAAQAYIADITPPEKRARGMGIIGAAFGLGFIFGPVISALFSSDRFGEWQYVLPGLIAAGLSVMNFVLAYFFLPESLKEEHRRPAQVFRLIDLPAFSGVMRHSGLRTIAVLFAVATLAYSGIFVTIPLFVSHAPFNLSSAEVSWFFIEIGVISAVVQGILIGRITAMFGERRLVTTGTLGLWSGFMLFPISSFLPAGQVTGLLIATAFLGFGSSFFTPNIMSLASQITPADEQGAVMGIIHSMASLARMIGPFLGGILYDAGGPNAPYVFSVVVMIAGVMCLRKIRHLELG